jgi:large subunit ribosomal protein L4e
MSPAAARPVISVYNADGSKTGETALPAVLCAPLRPDVVTFVHTNMAKNSRQAYAVQMKAGHQTSATSWGTGRAVARIPRVGGGGTQRSGQGAFGNMCRSGRMFAPTKIWRKWHKKINTTQKRFAVASALAASSIPALVMARGHVIDEVPELPLVLDAAVVGTKKTSGAAAALAALGAMDDINKSADSKKVRSGKGKMRNRRYRMRRGPLVIHDNVKGEADITTSFRNLPGVEVCHVDRLNLLQLAPGGHMGRFVIWTQSAFDKLDTIYGAGGKKIPNAEMNNADLARLINSDEVQSVLNPAKQEARRILRKKNPLKSIKAMEKLNPYAAAARRSEAKAQEARATKKAGARAKKTKKVNKAQKKAGKEYYEKVVAQGVVCEAGFTVE